MNLTKNILTPHLYIYRNTWHSLLISTVISRGQGSCCCGGRPAPPKNVCTKQPTMQELNVKGLVPSVFTPFSDDNKLNLCVVPEYAKYLKRNNVDGALVAGTASEGPNLSLQERKDLLDAWICAAKPLGVKIVMQVAGLPMPEVLEMARYSEKVRPDALLTLPELYYRPANVEALVRYVGLVSAAAPTLPIMYYDHPSLSNVKLNMAKFFSLATKCIPNFRGIKCGLLPAIDIDAYNEVADNQEIFMASHAIRAPSCMMGFNSSMSAIGNIFPRLMRDIDVAIQNKDLGLAKLLQRDLNRKVAALTSAGPYVQAVKGSLTVIAGLNLGDARDPLPRLTREQKNLLMDKLCKINR